MIDNDKIAELRRLEAKRPWDINDIDAVRNALPEFLDRLDDLVVENEMLRKVNSSLGHMLKPHGGVDVG